MRRLLNLSAIAAGVAFCGTVWAALFRADVFRALQLMAAGLAVLLVLAAVAMLVRGGRA